MPDAGVDTVAASRSLLKVEAPTHRWFIHGLLLVVTLITTTAFGLGVVQSFTARRPLEAGSLVDSYVRLYHLDPSFWRGLHFSLPLLVILLAHEFGHYVACRQNRVDASLPYFLPSPLLLGTFGAFIRIRSPIYNRKQLFDIGISGPLAGFVTLVPILLAGAALSKPVLSPGPGEGTLWLGLPLAMRAAVWLWFGRVPTHLALHPLAVAAWAGLLATAMNLLPMGQLDGGHILYSVIGERWHKTVSTVFVVVLIGLGFLYWPWWAWGALMFFLGRRHPLVYDRGPIQGARVALAAAALLIFVLSFAVVPVSLG